MNKQRLIELLTEKAFDIYDYDRRYPEVGMGPPVEWIVGKAAHKILEDAENWGYNNMNGLKQLLIDIEVLEVVDENLRKRMRKYG
jgi:hypothetical protein